MKKNIFSSLKYRIAITVFILEAIMLTFVLWSTFSFIEVQAKDDLSNRHEIIFELIEQISINSIFTEEYDDLQQYIEKISNDPEIINIAILNVDNIVIAHSDFQSVGSESTKKVSSGNRYWIKNRLSNLGAIEIEFSLEHIEKQLLKAKKLGISIAVVGMIVIAISGLIFGFLLTHKLDSLTKIIHKFKESGEYINVEVTGSDEIAILGNAFNHMSNKINSYISEIKADKYMLEVRVTERTKELDDTYGHDVGDAALVTIANVLTQNIRQTDVVGRWGGEEFMVVCPETLIEGALNLGEKLRSIIEKTNFHTIGNITCSFGVAEIYANETVKDIIKRADVALYTAKEKGRNCVVKASI